MIVYDLLSWAPNWTTCNLLVDIVPTVVEHANITERCDLISVVFLIYADLAYVLINAQVRQGSHLPIHVYLILPSERQLDVTLENSAIGLLILIVVAVQRINLLNLLLLPIDFALIITASATTKVPNKGYILTEKVTANLSFLTLRCRDWNCMRISRCSGVWNCENRLGTLPDGSRAWLLILGLHFDGEIAVGYWLRDHLVNIVIRADCLAGMREKLLAIELALIL